MDTTRRNVAVVAVSIALLVVGSASIVPSERVLAVEGVETGERYLNVPVADGTVVALTYTHSVEKTRVYDEYTVQRDQLVMTRMEFESYGWGLPSDANVTRENGTLVYDPPGRYSQVTVSPGETAGHELRVGQNVYDLVTRTKGESVHVFVTRRSALAAATTTHD